MGRLIKGLIILFLPLVIAAFLFVKYSSFVIKRVKGPTTKEQIEQSFQYALSNDYELLILGNSRIYRGINPDKINLYSSYNFAHDNDSYNQCYYKLKYLWEQNLKIRYLMLGVDYFQFSFLSNTRNYVYKDLFPAAYLKDFNEHKDQSLISWNFKSLNGEFNNFMTINFSQKALPFIDGLRSYFTGSDNLIVPLIKTNGQYINPGKGLEEDIIKRDFNILTIQKRYFEEIFDFCNKNGIMVIMVMPPVRKSEIQSFPPKVINQFDSLFNSMTLNSNHKYLSYKSDTRFSLNDFKDATHLNPEGADKFSSILNDDLNRLIKK